MSATHANARCTEARLELGLLAALPMLWPLLGARDRRTLRACCHATRVRADGLLEELRCPAFFSQFALLRERAWSGVLSRGARPRRLDLQLYHPTPVFAKFGLRLLAALGTLPSPALTDVRLRGLRLTAAMVAAIAAAAPRLAVLHLSGYDLLHCTGLRGSLPFSHGLSGVQGLLRRAAPQLQELALSFRDTGAAAPWLPGVLQQCSRLASLHLRAAPSEAVLGALPGLSSQLTQLTLDAHTEDALPAISQLRALVRLDIGRCTLRPEGLRLLARLTALKHLCVRTFELRQQPAADGAGGSPAARPPAPHTLQLPPQLESLYLRSGCSGSMHPTALAALRLPPCLTDLRLCHVDDQVAAQPQAVAVNRQHDLDEDHYLRPAVAEALLVACGQLAGRTRGGGVALSLGWPLVPPSWPNGYGSLLAALQPVMPRRLELRHVVLGAADVAALAQHLPLLEELELDCHTPVHAWPLLRRLERLRVLRLHPGMGNMAGLWAGYGNEQALRAALLALCVGAPRLQQLVLVPLPYYHDDAETHEAAQVARVKCQAAVVWLVKTLPRLRGGLPAVGVWCEVYDDESDSDGDGL